MTADQRREITIGRPRPGREFPQGAIDQVPPDPRVVVGDIEGSWPDRSHSVGQLLPAIKKFGSSPTILCGDLLVHGEAAERQLLPLGRERAVAQALVVAGQGEIAQRLDERFMNQTDVLPVGQLQREILLAGGREFLRQNVLNGQMCECDRFLARVGLFQPGQDEEPLTGAPRQIKGPRADGFGQLAIGGEVFATD